MARVSKSMRRLYGRALDPTPVPAPCQARSRKRHAIQSAGPTRLVRPFPCAARPWCLPRAWHQGRSRASAGHGLGAEDAREAGERRVERRIEIAADAGLRMEGLDAQNALGAVVLQVGAPDEPVAAEEGEHVVAVDALVPALVDLDHVPEAEDPLEIGAVPDEIVERREQQRRRWRSAA